MSQAIDPSHTSRSPGTGTPQSPNAKKSYVGLVVTLIIGAGLAGVIGVRVKEKLAEKKALEQSVADAKEQKGSSSISNRKRTYRTARGEAVMYKPAISITGTLSPIQESDIGFKVPGRLQSIRVKVGDTVKAGTLLATLDSAEAGAQAQAAAAGARAAEIGYEMAKDAQRRIDSLFEAKAISEAERTGVQQKAALAQAQYEGAKAQAQLASQNLGNTRIIAPFSGSIARVPSGVGRFVGPGEPLVHIDDTSVLKLSATLSEADASMVDVGSVFTIDDPAITAVLEGENAKPAQFKGRISAVLSSLDPQTRRVPIVGELPNKPPTGLRAGAFVRVTITPEKEINTIRLPAEALRPGSQDELVLVKSGKAHIARVALSLGDGGALYVRGGLLPSDEVVLEPSVELRDGDEVLLESQARAPAANTKP